VNQDSLLLPGEGGDEGIGQGQVKVCLESGSIVYYTQGGLPCGGRGKNGRNKEESR